MSTENNLKVSDVILKLDEIPVLRTNEMVKQALEKMSALKPVSCTHLTLPTNREV